MRLLLPLLILIVGAYVGFLLTTLLRKARSAKAARARVWAEGVPGTAQVLAAGSNGAVNHDPRVILTLEVTVAGEAPYRAEVTQVVDQLAMHRLGVGSQIEVRVDRVDPQVVVIDETLTPNGY